MSRTQRRVVLVAAFCSAAALVVSLLYGGKIVGIMPVAADSYGGGPLGHRLFAETLMELGIHVAQNRRSAFTTSSPLAFLEPRVVGRITGFDHDLADVLEERANAVLPTLVVLPKWVLVHSDSGLPTVTPDSVGPASIAGIAMPGAILAQVDDSAQRSLEGVLGTFVVEVPRLQVFKAIGTYDEVLLESAEGAVVVRTQTGLVVVSDPDLFHNYNFQRADHAELAMALLARAWSSEAHAIVLDETFHGHGKRYSLGEAMGEYPTVLISVNMVVLMLLIVAFGSQRFGPALPPPILGHGPAEGIAVSASVLADGQPFGSVVLQYVTETLRHLNASLGLPEAKTVQDCAVAIDTLLSATSSKPPGSAQAIYTAALRGPTTRHQSKDLWSIALAAHALREYSLRRTRGSTPGRTQSRPNPPSQPNPPSHPSPTHGGISAPSSEQAP